MPAAQAPHLSPKAAHFLPQRSLRPHLWNQTRLARLWKHNTIKLPSINSPPSSPASPFLPLQARLPFPKTTTRTLIPTAIWVLYRRLRVGARTRALPVRSRAGAPGRAVRVSATGLPGPVRGWSLIVAAPGVGIVMTAVSARVRMRESMRARPRGGRVLSFGLRGPDVGLLSSPCCDFFQTFLTVDIFGDSVVLFTVSLLLLLLFLCSILFFFRFLYPYTL